jgi:hypothetical protein
MEIKTTPNKRDTLEVTGVCGSNSGRIRVSKREIASCKGGKRYKANSLAVTRESIAGKMLAEIVLTRIVRGSKNKRVRLEKSAAKMSMTRRRCLIRRHASAGASRFPRQRLKDTRSRIVPSGQIQPQKPLPNSNPSRIMINAKPAP